MQASSGSLDSTTTLAAVHKLCSKANEVFHSLTLTNKRNIPQSQQADAVITVCYNCSSPDHTSDKCPLPCNEAKITKTIKVRTMSIDEGRASGGRGHGCRHGGGDCGGHGDDHTNTQGKWGAKDGPATLGTNTSMSDGVEKRNGLWMMNCKVCGWNDTHTHLSTMASGINISLLSTFLQPMCSGASRAKPFLWKRAQLLPLVQPLLLFPRGS